MDLQISQSFAYERKGDSAVILRCFSHDTRAEIPERIDGLPVKSLAPYAFSAMQAAGRSEEILERSPVTAGGSSHSDSDVDMLSENRAPVLCGDRVEEVVLPSTLEHVGRYCFYNCHHLRHLEFPGTLHDWGSGAFSGCHEVRKLCVHAEPDEDTGLKQVLDELPEELTVEFCRMDENDGLFEENVCSGKGTTGKKTYARLIFPAFYEEGVENTPARILETHVHGSGILFRNCFQGKKFDFAKYDRLFPHALAQESEAVLTELVLNRLRWPHRLEPQAQQTYETYVETHLLQFGKYYLREKTTGERSTAYPSEESGEGLQWFLERFLDPKNAVKGETNATQKLGTVMDELSEHAARLGDVQAISRLMEFRRSHMQAQTHRKRLRL